jgi:methylated-DNA-[protein]-cysteine S-methyltransferase
MLLSSQSMKTSKIRIFGFESNIGPCAVAFVNNEVTGIQLPLKTLATTVNKLKSRFKNFEVVSSPNKFEKPIIEQLKLHLQTGRQDFAKIKINIETTPFFSKVYETVQKIPVGVIVTYGQIAKAIGSPRAARAVGRAMAKNPIPLIVPCHRVIGSSGKLTGFSAMGGLKLKSRLLGLEQKI